MKELYCIINTQFKPVTDRLNEYGYNIISVEPSDNVSKPISMHADVLYLKTDINTLLISDCQKNNIRLLSEAGYSITTVKLKPGYKTECKLNMVITGKTIICNPDICMNLSFNNTEIIKVKQGYTKCSTIVLPEENYITEDEGIYEALKNAGKNCLLIEKGYVKLEGYNYGFIGGASAYLSENKTLLFFGNIKQHPNYKEITEFCHRLKIYVDYIENMSLTDIGGIIKL